MTRESLDRESFLANLRQSRLLAEAELRDLTLRLPKVSGGRAIARCLVELGKLTKFQAELLLIGRTNGFFFGPYKVLDQLGQGGMGRVYKALHQPMQRVVALKVLMPRVTKAMRAQEFFLREVQAAAQLSHPNIVTAYDAGELQGRHFFAMEFIDGPNLEELVRAQGPLPVGTACELIRQAACGLQHAHERGLLHRDLKPANLLVQPTAKASAGGTVKILDFGLARLREPCDVAPGSTTIVSRTNGVLGTPDFIAPEQARDLHKTDIRSDLYSLGCTLYWLLTGQVPFPGGAVLEKLLRHNTELARQLVWFRGDVPERVDAIVTRLMAKNPGDRFTTPQELSDALVPFAQPAPLNWGSNPRGVALSAVTPEPASPEDAAVETWPKASSLTQRANDSTELPGENFAKRRRSRIVQAACWSTGLAGAAIAAGLWWMLN